MEVAEVHGRLIKLMNEKNMSSYQLAKLMGANPSGIYNMFSRGTMPTIDTLDSMCKALELTLSEFFVFAESSRNIGYVSNDELGLLEIYRPMSAFGKERLKAYAEGILASENGNQEQNKS
ncbi:MAG: helix-turn-helix transcriptional regulator [Lachnospiraceae bacterium]|nr:helix-turn-helix transcriptional regulator [Lachnospiraceae bacterium]